MIILQIIEHQNIQLNNLIIYHTKVKHSDILKLTQYISDNLHVLNLKKNDNIIFAEKSHIDDEIVNVDFLIPVKGEIKECNEFDYKPIFKLNNAVIIRHEGNWNELQNTENLLHDFIKKNNFKAITSTYYVVVRTGNSNSEDCIIDIFIGVDTDHSK